VALAALGGIASALADPDVRARWPQALQTWAKAPAPPDDLLEDLRGDLRGEITDADDPLALIYENIVAGANRRHLGTFFTPAPIVEHMISHASDLLPDPEHVVDPGAGVGAFTLAGLGAWPNATVHSIDVNAVTLGLLAARINSADRLQLHHDDYLGWAARSLPTMPKTLVLGNPPYTRHQLMSANFKEASLLASGNLVQSRLAGLSAYFLAVTLNHLRDDSALAFLLPSTWNEANYGKALREEFWTRHHREVDLQFFDSKVTVFPGTQVTAMMLFVGPVSSRPQPMAFRAASLSKANSVTLVRSTVYPQRTGPLPARWISPSAETESTTDGATVPLGDLVTLRRGIATGANAFFFLTDDERLQWKLSDRHLQRAVVKSAHLDTDTIDEDAHDRLLAAGRRGWLLSVSADDVAESAPLGAYIEHGQQQGLQHRYLTRVRQPWYQVEYVAPAQILVAPVGQHKHSILLNHNEVRHSNSLYGLTMRPSVPCTAADVANWLRSEAGQRALRAIARHYSGGSLKIEPRALRTVPVPVDAFPGLDTGALPGL